MLRKILDQGFYFCKEDGSIYSLYIRKHKTKRTLEKAKKLKGAKHGSGYTTVGLWFNNKAYSFLSHRVVWSFFNGNIPSNKEINHINGNKIDNKLTNLELVTHSENMRHAFLGGKMLKGEKIYQSKLTEKQIIDIRKIKGSTQKEIANKFGISRQQISKILLRQRWAHI